MKLTVQEIAKLVQGEVQGDANAVVTGLAGFEDAKAGELTYVAEKRFLKGLKDSQAGAVLLPSGTPADGKTAILVANPQLAFLKVLNLVAQEKQDSKREIHPTAVISKSAKLGANVAVGPYSVIEDEAVIGEGSVIGSNCFIGKKTQIGKNCKFYPNVVVREEVSIGNSVTVHAGTAVGTDGFGYVFADKKHHKIPQIGTVVIEDDVEIGSNTVIDRATLGKTVIGAGSKIDNLVQIAHNVRIGKGCIVVSQAGIAGSSSLGNFVTLAGQVGVGDHVDIGDGVIIAAQSGIPNDVPAGSIVFGSPARPIREERKIQVIIGKLPEIYDDIKKIKKQLNPQESSSPLS